MEANGDLLINQGNLLSILNLLLLLIFGGWALIHHLLHAAPSPVAVQVKGGETMHVGFEYAGGSFSNVTLTGPADFVFDGTIAI